VGEDEGTLTSEVLLCKLLLQTSGNIKLLHSEKTGLPAKVLSNFHISSKTCRLLLQLLTLVQLQIL